jgi:ribonucleoside-diphosphate reductase alpha chain
MAKEGSTIGGLMDCFGTAVSINLQYGVPLEVLVNKFSHTRFEPMGHTTNPDIRLAKSIVDYIFRFLGITFLPGYREANRGVVPEKAPVGEGEGTTESELKPAATKAGGQTARQEAKNDPLAPTRMLNPFAPPSSANGNGNGHGEAGAALLERAGIALRVDQNAGPPESRSAQFARFQTDAPSCDNCGAITVRNGNCYLCHNCGNSMGCS